MMEMKVKEIISKYGFNQTIELLEKAVEDYGLKVVSTIDAQANLKKINVEVGGNKILEVFHPKLAKEVLDGDLRGGIVPPLRIYVYEQNGTTHVETQNVMELFSEFNGLEELGRKVDGILNSVINSVRQ